MQYVLVETSYAAPEQYDVYRDCAKVGGIRVRGGCLTAEAGIETVYDCRVDGDARMTEDERQDRLSRAVRAIHEYGLRDLGFAFRIMGKP